MHRMNESEQANVDPRWFCQITVFEATGKTLIVEHRVLGTWCVSEIRNGVH